MIEPGRDLDVKVAEAIGWTYLANKDLPHFSTDTAAAMTLLDAFPDWRIHKERPKKRIEEEYSCRIEWRDGISGWEFGLTVAMAICLSIIAAKEREDRDITAKGKGE